VKPVFMSVLDSGRSVDAASAHRHLIGINSSQVQWLQ
jgi:hypothetical protein